MSLSKLAESSRYRPFHAAELMLIEIDERLPLAPPGGERDLTTPARSAF